MEFVRTGGRRTLDEHVHTAVPGFAWGGAGLLLVFAAIDLARVERMASATAAAKLLVAAALLLLGLVHRRGALPTRLAQPILAAFFFAFFGIVAMGARVDPDPLPILVTAIAPIAASTFLLGHLWLTPIVGGAVLTEVLFLDGPASAWPLQARLGAALVVIVAPYIIMEARVRTHRSLDRAVQDARESEAAQRLLFDASPLPKWVYDAATLRILDANRAATRLYGYNRDTFLGMSILELGALEDQPAFLAQRATLQPDQPREAEARHVKADGTRLRVILTVVPIERQGRGAVIVTAQDVTERFRDQEALRESDERFHLLAKATKDVVWDWDLRTDALWWNANFCETFGYAAEEVEAGIEGWKTRIHAEDRERVESSIHDVIAQGGEHWEGEYRFLRKDGTYAVIFDRGYILRDASGRGIRMVGSMQDISALRATETTLRRQERLSALGTLVAGVAHEINNPLTYMQGNIELTQMELSDAFADPGMPEKVRVSLQGIAQHQETTLRGVEQLARIAQGLRHVARAGEGPRAPQDPNAIAASVVDVLRVRTKDDIELATDLRATQRVLANDGEITQVLLNLLLNAADATRGRSGARIQVRSYDDGGSVVLDVVDNGSGIPQDAQARIFTPFYTTKPTGTGLGLSISYRIAADHGGSLAFESEPGKGTVFRLRLPALSPLRTAK